MSKYTNAAYHQAIKNRINKGPWYVCLMMEERYYGGPEEGGWWGSDYFVEESYECSSYLEAEALADLIKGLADEMSQATQKEHGEGCRLSMEWLEARGLDADFLPEPDGPTRYYVDVCQEVPEPSYGSRQYS